MAGTCVGFGDIAVSSTEKNTSTHRTYLVVEETHTHTENKYTDMCVVCVSVCVYIYIYKRGREKGRAKLE